MKQCKGMCTRCAPNVCRLGWDLSTQCYVDTLAGSEQKANSVVAAMKSVIHNMELSK